jgi:hypothetical protein
MALKKLEKLHNITNVKIKKVKNKLTILTSSIHHLCGRDDEEKSKFKFILNFF